MSQPADTASDSRFAAHYLKVDALGRKLDVYRILVEHQIWHPAHQHAYKKLLRAGTGGQKSFKQDITEVVVALNRFLEMLEEEHLCKGFYAVRILKGFIEKLGFRVDALREISVPTGSFPRPGMRSDTACSHGEIMKAYSITNKRQNAALYNLLWAGELGTFEVDIKRSRDILKELLEELEAQQEPRA